MAKKFYAVHIGRKSNVVVETWAECQALTGGHSGSVFKSFKTKDEAAAFAANGPGAATAAAVAAAGGGTYITLPPIEMVPQADRIAGSITEEHVVVYTDGSCLGNGMRGGGAAGGVGVFFGTDDPRNVSEALGGGRQTNNRAELTAVLRALQTVPARQPVEIRTDSKYTIDAMTKWRFGWQKNNFRTAGGGAVENADLIMDISGAVAMRAAATSQKDGAIKWTYVPGHRGEPGNEAADFLARQGAVRR
ncbi:RnaseH-domain-containing protein [Ramicandelaber brevisporus]|nr:RnaseH-domain-containing protein [Ramicandelaber brevisporus]